MTGREWIGYYGQMECPECVRQRQALAKATDDWIIADNRAAASGSNDALKSIAQSAKLCAAKQNDLLAKHAATHSQ
jgi:hypothetical protein